MQAEFYRVEIEKEQYRAIERENGLGEKSYFLQHNYWGHHFYKSGSFIWNFWKYKLHHSELAWTYVFKKQNTENPEYESVHTKEIVSGKEIKVDLNEYINRGCKSLPELKAFMYEYREWLKYARKNAIKKNAEEDVKKKEEEAKKLTPIECMIPLLYI